MGTHAPVSRPELASPPQERATAGGRTTLSQASRFGTRLGAQRSGHLRDQPPARPRPVSSRRTPVSRLDGGVISTVCPRASGIGQRPNRPKAQAGCLAICRPECSRSSCHRAPCPRPLPPDQRRSHGRFTMISGAWLTHRPTSEFVGKRQGSSIRSIRGHCRRAIPDRGYRVQRGFMGAAYQIPRLCRVLDQLGHAASLRKRTNAWPTY